MTPQVRDENHQQVQFNMEKVEMLRSLEGHGLGVVSVASTSDGASEQLASCMNDAFTVAPLWLTLCLLQ